MDPVPFTAEEIRKSAKKSALDEKQIRQDRASKKREETQELPDNPWEQGQIRPEAVYAAAEKAYNELDDSFGEEHWAFSGGFEAGIKWYQEQLNKK
ncbi:MAG: hypothetical protein P8J32_04280 [bacterium]|nr:hypothetical protein [bacterium]